MSTASSNPVRVGVVGIHGFARQHLDRLRQVEGLGQARVVAAVAHAREQDPAWADQLAAAGIALLPDVDALLARDDLELVTLPLGIHLHLPMAQKVLARRLAVYLEKPVAGCLADHDRIAALTAQAGVPLFVGFQHMFLPSLRTLQSALASGRWGAVRRIVVTAGWPRDDAYYARNNWAGKLAVNGSPVRDSPANNACAHYLNLALFLAGAPGASAVPRRVDAALSRHRAIESFDTCGLHISTQGGTEVVFNASHAGAVNLQVRVRIECERASITNADAGAPKLWCVSTGEEFAPEADSHPLPYLHACRHLRGGTDPVGTLALARPHTQVIETVHQGPIGTRSGDPVAIDRALDAAHAAGEPLVLPGTTLATGLVCPA